LCVCDLLWDIYEKVQREDIFKPTNGNEHLHVISNDNGMRVVNFATSKNVSRVQCSYLATLIYTYTLSLFLMGWHTIRLITFW